MFLIDIHTNRPKFSPYDPIVNQSLDNYLMNDLALEGRGFIVYINAPSVIIGRNQNAYDEVNLKYLEDNNITLVRRSSGGGAVYHDYGNLIFENIHVGDPSHATDFSYYAEPIIKALRSMGLDNVEMQGRNDITVNGLKCSGMATARIGNNVISGGTLMFDLDTDQAGKVLTPNKAKLATKGIQSVAKRVTNLKPLLPAPFNEMTSEEFRQELLKRIFEVDDLNDIETYVLTEDDWKIITERVENHYGTDAWNFGKNPGFDHYERDYFVGVGTVAFNFSVKEGKISAFKTYGDMSFGNPAVVDEAMVGQSFDRDGITKGFEVGHYEDNIGKLPVDALVELVLRAENE
ncbi:MAG: lipoate--protein ligase [Aerococcus sp.]|nr:lipoate--protein ligase [Aerococcus sp.]